MSFNIVNNFGACIDIPQDTKMGDTPIIPALPLSNRTSPAAAKWTSKLLIVNDGPYHAGEWWTCEIMSFLHGTPTSLTIPFDISALWLSFFLLKTTFPSRTTIFPDIFNLVTMLPIQDQEMVEKKTLVQLVLVAARECNMRWWREQRERMFVLMGVVLAGLVLRRVGLIANLDDDVLGALMEKMDLGVIEDVDIMDRLTGLFDESMKI